MEDDVSLFSPQQPESAVGENCVSASAIVLSHLIAHILYFAFDLQNVFLGLREFTNY